MSYEAIYNDGFAAFQTGKAEAASPYYPQTDYGKAWKEGYEDARGPLPKLGPLEFHTTCTYAAAFIACKTHKLGVNRFAAVGAIFFQGHRGVCVPAVGTTRREAEKNVMAIIDSDPYAAERSEHRLRAMGG